MNEEEIIKEIKVAIKSEGSIDIGDLRLECLQGLLDLYENEKAENRHLKVFYKDSVSKYIIKDKIRDFQRVKEEILKLENSLGKASITYDIVRNDYCEEMLKELLEEE